jgi:hypothetical protein
LIFLFLEHHKLDTKQMSTETLPRKKVAKAILRAVDTDQLRFAASSSEVKQGIASVTRATEAKNDSYLDTQVELERDGTVIRNTPTQISGSTRMKLAGDAATPEELKGWFMQFKKQCHGFFKVRLVNDEYVAYRCENAADPVDGTVDNVLANLMLDTPTLTPPPVAPPVAPLVAPNAALSVEVQMAQNRSPKMWGK